MKTRLNAIIFLSLRITGASLQEASITVISPLSGIWYLSAEIPISLDVTLHDGPRVERVRAKPEDYEICIQWDSSAVRCSSIVDSSILPQWPPLNTSSKFFLASLVIFLYLNNQSFNFTRYSAGCA